MTDDYERGVEQASAIYKEAIREYVSDNNKLRGLLRDVWLHMVNAAWHEDSPNPSAFADRMHELGIEVG